MGRTLALLAALWLIGGPVAPITAQQPAPVLSQLTWFDRTGQELDTLGPVANHGNIELSPDGTRVAVAVAENGIGARNIWIYEADGRRTQLTDDAADENWMIWSADGQRVVFNAFTSTMLSLIEAPATPGGERTSFLADPTGKWPVSWSADGASLLVVTSSARTGNDVWMVPMQGRRRPLPFAVTAASENWATFSPDGKWVAFSSTEGDGRAQVYVARFPPDGRRVQISREGGTQARWRSADEILFVSGEGRLMSAAVQIAENRVEVGLVNPLFTITYPFGAYHAFDVTPDGRRILVNSTVVPATAPTQSVRGSGWAPERN